MAKGVTVSRISGAGFSRITQDSENRGKDEFNKMVIYYHKNGELKEYKTIDENFNLDDLIMIANESTFELFAAFLENTAEKNILKEINKDDLVIETDDDTGEFKHLSTVLVYFSNFQNFLMKRDTKKEIRFFDQFRICTNRSAPAFITKIRNGITNKLNRFCIEHGIILKVRSNGLEKKQVEELNNEIRKQGNNIL